MLQITLNPESCHMILCRIVFFFFFWLRVKFSMFFYIYIRLVQKREERMWLFIVFCRSGCHLPCIHPHMHQNTVLWWWFKDLQSLTEALDMKMHCFINRHLIGWHMSSISIVSINSFFEICFRSPEAGERGPDLPSLETLEYW